MAESLVREDLSSTEVSMKENFSMDSLMVMESIISQILENYMKESLLTIQWKEKEP